MRFSTSIFVSSLCVASTYAATARTVYQFPNSTWVENVMSTRNSSLLVTILGRAEVYMVNPNLPIPTASLIAAFPSANAVLGISELETDLYVVGVGSTTSDNQPIPRSFSIWTIDLSPHDEPPKITKIVDTPNMQLINGVAALNEKSVLLADSFAGNIVRLDIKTKQSSVVLRDKSLEPNFTASLPIGVNGIRLDGSTLFYTNTVQNLTGRVDIDTRTGKKTSPFRIITKGNGMTQPDDFAVTKGDDLLVSSPVADTFWRVKQSGEVETILKGGEVAGATSAAFLRGRDERKVYLSTSGLVNGVLARGGRVVEVTL